MENKRTVDQTVLSKLKFLMLLDDISNIPLLYQLDAIMCN